jgi:hypothetical protein
VVLHGQPASFLHVKQGEADREMATANAAMTNPTRDDPACGLLCLPTSVLLLLFDRVVKVSNAGQLLRLALVGAWCEHDVRLLLLLFTVVALMIKPAAKQMLCMDDAVDWLFVQKNCLIPAHQLLQLLLCMHPTAALAVMLEPLTIAQRIACRHRTRA